MAALPCLPSRGLPFYLLPLSTLSSSQAAEGSEAPAVLLVHGFGAFGEHWRRNVQELADSGYRVFAPTYPGEAINNDPRDTVASTPCSIFPARLWLLYVSVHP